MLSLAETGWVGIAVATGCGVLKAVGGVGQGVGLVIPGKAIVGEAVPHGATAAAVIHACQCPFSLTKSSLLIWNFPFQANLPGYMTLWDPWNYKVITWVCQ